MELNRTERYKLILQQLILDAKEDNGWSYPWLSRKLSEKGFDVTDKNLGTKIRTGIISGQLLLAIIEVCNIEINAEKLIELNERIGKK